MKSKFETMRDVLQALEQASLFVENQEEALEDAKVESKDSQKYYQEQDDKIQEIGDFLSDFAVYLCKRWTKAGSTAEEVTIQEIAMHLQEQGIDKFLDGTISEIAECAGIVEKV